jgi:hypothetical protein
MSRGPGYMQQYLFRLLRHSDKPMTFVNILARAFPEGSYEAGMVKALGPGNVARVRSLRRAMKGLVDDNAVIAIGEGGPADPKRYWVNPMMVVMSGNKDDFDKATAMLEREPGGVAAMNKTARTMFKPSDE